jgi:hypothetical protein
MRYWLIKKLGGVDKHAFDRLMEVYQRDLECWKETVERYNLQAAWAQTKLERKQRRYH